MSVAQEKNESLDETMSFGRVVSSDGNGTVTPVPYDVAMNTRTLRVDEIVYLSLDSDGQSFDDNVYGLPDGWSLLSGFTGQDRYTGPVMDASEYIGGGLERHIRENAGYYVALIVDGIYDDDRDTDDEDLSIGWLTAFRPFDQ